MTTLYIVATPIGNLADFTQRAIDTLKQVDVIACEDTRHSRHLLNHYAISTPTISLHEHNEKQRTIQIIERLQQGESVALVSDAGTPLISDPGQYLLQQAHAHNINVAPIPGACALISALSVSGLATGAFAFEGFLPAKSGDRKKQLQTLVNEARTLVFYESPHRIVASVNDMLEIFGADRKITMARELTKKFETVITTTLAELSELMQSDPQQQKGEFVLIVAGAEAADTTALDIHAEHTLSLLLEELPLNKAVKLAVKITGLKKNTLYARALELKN